MEVFYQLMEVVLPFSFLRMNFMKNALLGILLAAPILGLLSTMIVNQKMAFFSDAIGHSALTGIGIGVLLGFTSPRISMLLFALILATAITFFSHYHEEATDTVIGVFSAGGIALGTAILSRGGNFNAYTGYLIGDILSITPKDLGILVLLIVVVGIFWMFLYNALVVISLNASLAGSRKINVFGIRLLFTLLVAAVVVMCIPWIGILLINAFLVLPGAIAKRTAKNIRQFHLHGMLIALICGIIGLILAYYLGTAAGATIILVMISAYLIQSFKK